MLLLTWLASSSITSAPGGAGESAVVECICAEYRYADFDVRSSIRSCASPKITTARPATFGFDDDYLRVRTHTATAGIAQPIRRVILRPAYVLNGTRPVRVRRP